MLQHFYLDKKGGETKLEEKKKPVQVSFHFNRVTALLSVTHL